MRLCGRAVCGCTNRHRGIRDTGLFQPGGVKLHLRGVLDVKEMRTGEIAGEFRLALEQGFERKPAGRAGNFYQSDRGNARRASNVEQEGEILPEVKWSIEGPHVVNCNCAYGCPCQFVALPTDGTCKAVVGWRIDKGHFGDVRLEGLLAVNLYAWPGPIHHGKGSMQSIIDGRADPAQCQALAAIPQGEGAEPGSVMLQFYRAMCTTYHEPLFRPIELELDLKRRAAAHPRPGGDFGDAPEEPGDGGGAPRADRPAHGQGVPQGGGSQRHTKAGGVIPLKFANNYAHFSDAPLTSGGVRA